MSTIEHPSVIGLDIMPIPQEPHKEFNMHHYEGFTHTIYTVDREVDFPEGALITSRTDTKGIITHANEAFVIMSGYPREELIGRPHSILRHPDMPKVAFAGLWETINKGEKWHGYVKNLRKDGAYYWVYATVVPNIRNGQIQGYTSVRRKAAPSKIAEMSSLYKELIKQEQGA